MNRLAGFVLVAGFLASSAAVSGSVANKVTQGKGSHRASLAVQQLLASVVQPAAPAATLAPAKASQRVVHASQAAARAALAPVSAEITAESRGSASACPPAHTDLACRAP